VEEHGVKVSLITVCHHSSGVLPESVQSFRHQAEAAGVASEVVVVEQSEDEGEAAQAEACGPDLLLRRPNRGYAAGINAGVAEASGELVFLANPDLVFLDGSVGELVGAVAGGADVAGPQYLWDRAGEVLLPIPDDPRPAAELARTVRRRWPRRRELEDRIESSWRVWTGDRPQDVVSLRGSLMAVSRDTLERLGPLDEGYFLYYEETEWLWRAHRRGARLRLAPRSRVVHRWGHSTVRCPDRAEIEERSRTRFFERNYSAPVRALLGRLSRSEMPADPRFELVDSPWAVPRTEADVWTFSTVSHMEPFAGCLAADALLPAACELTSVGRWYAVAARREGRRWRIDGRWTWEME
jgi:GT2 family glycosyltransferase